MYMYILYIISIKQIGIPQQIVPYTSVIDLAL
jgi:hypothetical protein